MMDDVVAVKRPRWPQAPRLVRRCDRLTGPTLVRGTPTCFVGLVARRLSALVVVAGLAWACGAPEPTPTSPSSVQTPGTNAGPSLASGSSPSAAAVQSLDPRLGQRWLAFSAGVEGEHSNIFVSRADGSELRQITDGTDFRYNPVWSPDGSRLLYRVEGPEGAAVDPSRDGIWIVEADGNGNRSISKASGIFGGGHSQPWSPDGTRVLMAGARLGGGRPRIWVMKTDGTEPRALTPDSYEAQYPAWSPDGKRIAFSAVIEGRFELFVMNADGSDIHPLTKGPEDNWPSWSPDGTRLAFGSGQGLAVMNADGSDIRTLTTGLGVPATWAPGDVVAANCPLANGAIGICAIDPAGRLTTLLGGINAGFPAWRSAQ
jgi:WD40 repeat protein